MTLGITYQYRLDQDTERECVQREASSIHLCAQKVEHALVRILM